jgi:hypothetical protein
MCLPSNSACFFFDLCSRQRLRFSLTSRMPTVICVGRNDKIGIGCSSGSRVLAMTSYSRQVKNLSLDFQQLTFGAGIDYSPVPRPRSGIGHRIRAMRTLFVRQASEVIQLAYQ